MTEGEIQPLQVPRLKTSRPETQHGYGWLAAVLPVAARRYRVQDPTLAAILRDAGAELVQDAPEVEIASHADIRGDADLAIVTLGTPIHDDHRVYLRVLRRLARSIAVRFLAGRVCRSLRRRG